MGSEKVVTNNTSTATPTAEETALNKLNLDTATFMQPFQKQLYQQLAEGNLLPILSGQTPAATGIGGITEGQTQEMVNASLRDLYPQFQANGLVDSGSALQAGVRTAADIRNANAQFNTSANQNLFNIAVGGQSNLQAQGTQLSSVLGQQLAGLRTVNSTSTTQSMNPFLKSFQTSAGQSFGKSTGQAAGNFLY